MMIDLHNPAVLFLVSAGLLLVLCLAISGGDEKTLWTAGIPLLFCVACFTAMIASLWQMIATQLGFHP